MGGWHDRWRRGGLTRPRRQSLYPRSDTATEHSMRILIVGASKAGPRRPAEGLGQDAEMIIGVSRKAPTDLTVAPSCALRWIEADLSDEAAAAHRRAGAGRTGRHSLQRRRVGRQGFHRRLHDFLADSPQQIARLLDINITGTILAVATADPAPAGSRQAAAGADRFDLRIAARPARRRSALQGGAVGHCRRAARAFPRAAAGGHLPAAGLPEHRGRAGGGAR